MPEVFLTTLTSHHEWNPLCARNSLATEFSFRRGTTDGFTSRLFRPNLTARAVRNGRLISMTSFVQSSKPTRRPCHLYPLTAPTSFKELVTFGSRCACL